VPGKPNLTTHLVALERGDVTYVERVIEKEMQSSKKYIARRKERLPNAEAARQEQLGQIKYGDRGEFVQKGKMPTAARPWSAK